MLSRPGGTLAAAIPKCNMPPGNARSSDTNKSALLLAFAQLKAPGDFTGLISLFRFVHA